MNRRKPRQTKLALASQSPCQKHGEPVTWRADSSPGIQPTRPAPVRIHEVLNIDYSSSFVVKNHFIDIYVIPMSGTVPGCNSSGLDPGGCGCFGANLPADGSLPPCSPGVVSESLKGQRFLQPRRWSDLLLHYRYENSYLFARRGVSSCRTAFGSNASVTEPTLRPGSFGVSCATCAGRSY